jgi:tetratricopeptide (TPR) repeat protein
VDKRSIKSPFLIRAFQGYLKELDTASFMMAIAPRYSLGTLARLASSRDVPCRRAAAFSLGLLGNVKTVELLGPMLADEDRHVRLVADDGIKAIWQRRHSLYYQNQSDTVSGLIEQGNHDRAIVLADSLINLDNEVPDWWCQRGLAKLHIDDISGALHDCERATRICKFHYPAWIGIAYCRLEQAEPLEALNGFRQSLEIYPDLEHIRLQVRHLERALWELQ